MSMPIRLTFVMTHPIQYYSPWFRFIANEEPELALTVLYVSEPSPSQQGASFGTPFQWDIPLREGYDNEVLRPSPADADFGSDSFWGLDCPGIGNAVEGTRPDVVLLSGWHSASLVRAMFACRRRRIPILYRGDTHLVNGGGSFAWRARTRFLLSRFDRYLSVGVRAREYLNHFDIDDSLILASPHAVDNEFFAECARPYRDSRGRAEARASLDIAAGAFVVLFVGKIDANKRVDDLIDALALMENDAVLVVVGNGPLESMWRQRAEKNGIDVRWCGFLNQSELGRAYGMADCLVLPSASETWGLVVNESLAAGLPCVVSDRVGCVPDLVLPGETGEVFPCGDREALARAIERVRRGDDRSSACQAHVAHYGFESSTKGLLSACRVVVE